ncbi:hypothetical protein IJT17_04295 [bacterium]|nr:hypothetical protein [bacterium]
MDGMNEKSEKVSRDAASDPQVQLLVALKAIQRAIYDKLAAYQKMAAELRKDEPAITEAVQNCQAMLKSSNGASEEELQTLRAEFMRVENMLGQAISKLRALQAGCEDLRASGRDIAERLEAVEANIKKRIAE